MHWTKKEAYDKTMRLQTHQSNNGILQSQRPTTVKALLGHKDLRTTLRYTQLLEAMPNDEYHCKTAKDVKEATQLIENGFGYITEIDRTKLLRKRK
jgi:integrase